MYFEQILSEYDDALELLAFERMSLGTTAAPTDEYPSSPFIFIFIFIILV